MLALQGALDRLGTGVVEAHPVERCPLGRQAKQPRLGITHLGVPSDRAQLGKAKTKAMPNPSRHGVLIETSGQAHRIAETTAKQGLLQPGIGPLQLRGQARQRTTDQGPAPPQGGLAQGREGELAELLRIGAPIGRQEGAHKTLVEHAG